MVVVGYWPPQIEFDTRDLATVVDVLDKQAKQAAKNARKR